MTALLRRVARPLCAVVLVLAAAGCYVPVRFDAEIEIDRAGYYSLIFDGYVARAALFKDIKEGALTATERERRLAQVERDLARDEAASEVAHVRDGIFKLHWKRSGDLLAAKSVSFLRRNETLLSLSYVRSSGRITVAGTPVSDSQAQQIEDMGLTIQGEVRVITDARVIDHNAASERDWPDKGPRFKMYTFPVPNPRAPTPKLTIQIHDPIGG
jgi:hypothetical protein